MNPAGAEYEVLGVYSPDLLQSYARAAKSLGAKRVMVVASKDGYDEISPCAETLVYQINGDGKEYKYTISPEKFADENNYWPVRLLKSIARIPYYENSFLTFGHTISNSEEATYAANTDKVGAILISPIPDPLEPVICSLSSDKEIEFLQVFPVTKDEMSYRKTYDSNTLIARLEDTKKALGVRKWIDFALSRMTSLVH